MHRRPLGRGLQKLGQEAAELAIGPQTGDRTHLGLLSLVIGKLVRIIDQQRKWPHQCGSTRNKPDYRTVILKIAEHYAGASPVFNDLAAELLRLIFRVSCINENGITGTRLRGSDGHSGRCPIVPSDAWLKESPQFAIPFRAASLARYFRSSRPIAGFPPPPCGDFYQAARLHCILNIRKCAHTGL